MPLSYLFASLRSLTLIRHVAFWKRAWSWPDFPASRAPFAATRERRIAKYPKHLLHDLLALFFTASLGEHRQKGMDSVLGQRKAELPRIQAERRAGLVHGGARQIIGRHAEHQFLGRHIWGFDIEHVQPHFAFERAQISLDVPAVAIHAQDLLRRQSEGGEEIQFLPFAVGIANLDGPQATGHRGGGGNLRLPPRGLPRRTPKNRLVRFRRGSDAASVQLPGPCLGESKQTGVVLFGGVVSHRKDPKVAITQSRTPSRQSGQHAFAQPRLTHVRGPING